MSAKSDLVTHYEVREHEPRYESGWNDVQSHGEFIASFGSKDVSELLVRGFLMDSVVTDHGVLSEDGAEDDGAIPIARHTPLTPGERTKLEAFIGDGPHGSGEGNTGDYDFYYIGVVQAGQVVTAQIKTPSQAMPRLDTKVGLYDATGYRSISNDNGRPGEPDSYLEAPITATGEYWVLVRGGNSAWPLDPFDPASGPKAGSEGPYTLLLGIDVHDTDYYLFDLEAGDVFSAGAEGEVRITAFYDPSETLRIATKSNWSTLYPEETLLYKGGHSNIAAVASRSGRYAIAVARGTGEYAILLKTFRSPLESALSPQILFVDFDGANYDASRQYGHANAELSSLRQILQLHQLEAEENRIIDVVMSTIHENLVDDLHMGPNSNFRLELRNSRDDPDLWTEEGVSRIIVGGTRAELGINTVGLSQSVDVGNVDFEESAVVLLDYLIDPTNPDSPSSIAHSSSLTIADVIGKAIGVIASHEGGHLFGSFHTGFPGFDVDLMTAGQDPRLLLGIGPDSTMGTPDDVDIDLGESPYQQHEPFWGFQDTRSAVAFGLFDTKATSVEHETIGREQPQIELWPTPATSRLHISIELREAEPLHLTLYDALGRGLMSKKYQTQGSHNRLVIPTEGIASGVYLLRIGGNSFSDTRRVVIVQ